MSTITREISSTNDEGKITYSIDLDNGNVTIDSYINNQGKGPGSCKKGPINISDLDQQHISNDKDNSSKGKWQAVYNDLTNIKLVLTQLK